jgi:hypothetical protein
VYSNADLESIKEELKQLAVINECDFENEAHFRVHPETRKRRIKLIEYEDECVDFIKGIRDRKYYHDTKEWETEFETKLFIYYQTKIKPIPVKITYYFSEYQQAYDELKAVVPFIEFKESKHSKQ